MTYTKAASVLVRENAMRYALFLAALFALGFSTPYSFAQSDLPASTQADLLRQEIFVASTHHEDQRVILDIERYKALNVPFPPPYFFIEAGADYKLHDPIKALSALTEYFNAASKTDSLYEKAVALYPAVHRAAVAASERLSSDKLALIPPNVQNEVCHSEERTVTVAGETTSTHMYRDGFADDDPDCSVGREQAENALKNACEERGGQITPKCWLGCDLRLDRAPRYACFIREVGDCVVPVTKQIAVRVCPRE